MLQSEVKCLFKLWRHCTIFYLFTNGWVLAADCQQFCIIAAILLDKLVELKSRGYYILPTMFAASAWIRSWWKCPIMLSIVKRLDTLMYRLGNDYKQWFTYIFSSHKIDLKQRWATMVGQQKFFSYTQVFWKNSKLNEKITLNSIKSVTFLCTK